LLREFLELTDEPCPACGYSLRGLQAGACPECGERLSLRIGLVEPRLGLYLTGLVGLACGLGFNGMILAWWMYELLFTDFPMGLEDAWTLVPGVLACGCALGGWLFWRGPVRRAPASIRFLLVAACWLVSGATAVAFFSSVN
jgi:hypothetical protein